MDWKEILMAILYELQPIRSKDATILSKWIYKNVLQIFYGFLALSSWIYEQVLNLPSLVSRTVAVSSVLWLVVFYLFHYVGFGSLYFMITVLVGIFSNLGKRAPGELSAYSVFNANFQSLLGTLTADQIDKQLRHAVEQGDDDDWTGEGNRDGHRPPVERPNLQHRKISGKKSRRGYEKKVLRRQQERGQNEHGGCVNMNPDVQLMEFEFGVEADDDD